MEDLYALLGVSPNATANEIKQRFRFLAQAYHPDKFATDEHRKQAEEQFKKINDAYQVLSNPAKRAKYDNERLKAKPVRHQETPNQAPNASNQNYTRPEPTTKTNLKTPRRRANKSFSILIVASLLAGCGFVFLCFIGLPLLNSDTPVTYPTNTPTIHKTITPKPVIPTNTRYVPPPTYTPTLTLTPLDGRLVITDKDSGITWEIAVEKTLVADSLTSPTTGNIDRAAGRFAILFLQITNRGLSTNNFVCVCGKFDIQDADGNRYKDHFSASTIAEQIYETKIGLDSGLDINPDTTAHIITVFDISTKSDFYVLVSGFMSEVSDSRLVINIP